MEVIGKTLNRREVTEAISSSNRSPEPKVCWRCFGTGIRFRDAATGHFVRSLSIETVGVELLTLTCLCSRRRTARAVLRQVPPAFKNPKLSRLKPIPGLHPKQATVIPFVQQRPCDSFLLLGKNYVGKSHIAWALFRHAIAQGRSAVACPLRDLLAEFRRVEIGASDGETLKSPRVTTEQLKRPGKPRLIFLDEFEKARPTEFASEQLCNLLDAARDYKHQMVITSNMKAGDLRDHWSRIDETWGNSIMTRLQDCHVVEMF